MTKKMLTDLETWSVNIFQQVFKKTDFFQNFIFFNKYHISYLV
jgi:hypothetical protein